MNERTFLIWPGRNVWKTKASHSMGRSRFCTNLWLNLLYQVGVLTALSMHRFSRLKFVAGEIDMAVVLLERALIFFKTTDEVKMSHFVTIVVLIEFAKGGLFTVDCTMPTFDPCDKARLETAITT